MFLSKRKIVYGYRPLNQTMFDRKDSEIKRRLPFCTKMRIRGRDVPAILNWFKEQELDFDFQSFEGHIYFYLADSRTSTMLKLTWQTQ